MRRRTIRGAVAIMALTTAALIGTAGSALACYSDDGRSNPIPDRSHAPCADGQKLDHSDVDFTGGEGKSTLNITKVHDGVTVTRIVVIGGDDGFNEYIPGKAGKGGEKLAPTAPWNDLKATKTFKGRQPNIDKWFLCGKKTEKPTQTVTAPTKTSAPATTTTKPSAPATSETSVSPSSTTAPAVVPAGNESGTGGGLANTGFDNSWLIWVGALLLVAGGGLLALLKFRRKASE
ncbi:LPXTG cell wall anchor domain-containing protein [Amycolatopsis sp. A133]|jgi:LPXTG-motif cell wall-anchored protein|uniref:LPXTG cell wall anchor domain-containing protein n=1 Tax=Amycolatopsis sp. A133 TaxID=3064472 RepID=UPI0027F4F27B|nr:LPXTG cell wall anchor domain-containing protein [Amycolatopsis sp. A133]MDQ7809763.1 LPXTG cell wall anchor domain-containing protein [Amycolatopsis sp. A133]